MKNYKINNPKSNINSYCLSQPILRCLPKKKFSCKCPSPPTCIRPEPPVILSPEQGEIITDRQPIISGSADPGNEVCICVDHLCIKTIADRNGSWSVRIMQPLDDGEHTITATQTDCLRRKSDCAVSMFTVKEVPCPIPNPPLIVFPAEGQVIAESQPFIRGMAEPASRIYVCIDTYCVNTVTDISGNWSVLSPISLDPGSHTVTASQTNYCGEISAPTTSTFIIEQVEPCPIPESPVIIVPAEGEVLFEEQPSIIGTGIPGNTIQVCIEETCIVVMVDENGNWSVQAPSPLALGSHTVTATQTNPCGNTSQQVTVTFSVEEAVNELLIEDLRRGLTFRTVDTTFVIGRMSGDWTVYYLLLSPDLPAPTENEIINYDDAVTLSNGMAARGMFTVPITEANTTQTRMLPGRETPVTLPTETGVVDGLRYILYMVGVTSNMLSTGIAYSPNTDIGMPFDSGEGTADNPFIVRQLTVDELSNYPDLIAGNPGNRAGVNEIARQLDNIEGMRVLHDTNIQNGMTDSLTLNYQIQGNFNLSGYDGAYGGNGWRPIGNYDSTHYTPELETHIFTGTLTGDAGISQISNISITPVGSTERWVQYVGFIGYAAGATITNIGINGADIVPIPVLPTNIVLRASGLCARANNCAFINDSVNFVRMNFDFGQGAVPYIEAGGVVGEMIGDSIDQINVSEITIADQSGVYSYLGGLVGYSHNNTSPFIVRNSTVSGIHITGFTGSSAYTGGTFGYLRAVVPCTINQLRADDVTCDNLAVIGGGLIGILRVDAATALNNLTVNNIAISSLGSELSSGGVIGGIYAYYPLTITNVQVTDSNIHATSSAGGMIGDMSVLDGGEVNIGYFTITATASVDSSYAGGMAGSIYREPTSFLYIHDGTVLSGSSISGPTNIGGLVGDVFESGTNAFTYIENCSVAASVLSVAASSQNYFGGICGFASLTALNDCVFSGSVNGGRNYTGGLLGGGYGNYIGDCVCTGSVTGIVTVGGLAGDMNYSGIFPSNDGAPFEAASNVIERSSMRGSISVLPSGTNIGGIVGRGVGVRVSQCFSLSDIAANNYAFAGGIMGISYVSNTGVPAEIINSYATGNVTGTGSDYGGVIGASRGSVLNSYGAGTISGEGLIGGIAGTHIIDSASITASLALNPLVSAQLSTGARIVNATAVLLSNYALDSLVLEENGVPVTPVNDPNGSDGGTITTAEILNTVTTLLLWDTTTIWDTSTIATLGRPTLLQNPE